MEKESNKGRRGRNKRKRKGEVKRKAKNQGYKRKEGRKKVWNTERKK